MFKQYKAYLGRLFEKGMNHDENHLKGPASDPENPSANIVIDFCAMRTFD